MVLFRVQSVIRRGSGAWNSSRTEESFRRALAAGFTSFDTAHEYGNQEGVGRALAPFLQGDRATRAQIFLQTKVPGCVTDPSSLDPFRCFNDTSKILHANLRELNASFVDLVLLHYPPAPAWIARTCGNLTGSCEMIRAQWHAMETFYAAGFATAIGVSNYCPSCFACLADAAVQPMVNQLRFHVGMGADPDGFASFCKTHGCVMQAYGTLGNPPLDPRDPGASKDILHGKLTTSIAKAHNVSAAQVALKWIVQHGFPAITKADNPQFLAEDIALWPWELTAGEMAALDAHRMPNAGQPSFVCDLLGTPTPL
eukprot:COSAG01_NODE_11486_length_1924_cov_1.311781_2_plen_312_part_00